MVEILEFAIGGYWTGTRVVNVWVEDGKKFKSYQGDNRDPEACYEKEVSLAERELFESKLAETKILEWKRDYFNPNVMDGTQWGITIKDSERKRNKQISGSNDYPNQWDDFIRALAVLIPEIINETISREVEDR